MATRRKIGVTAMSTEAARRTQHWTKQLIPGYKFEVFGWTKTDAPQVPTSRVEAGNMTQSIPSIAI